MKKTEQLESKNWEIRIKTENTSRESQICGKFLAGLAMDSRVGLQTEILSIQSRTWSQWKTLIKHFSYIKKNVSKTSKATF